MVHIEREISKEVYDRNKDNRNGFLANDDYSEVFTLSEAIGYGVYCPRVYERDGKYYCSFERGDSCD